MNIEYDVCPKCGHDRFIEHTMVSTIQHDVRIYRNDYGEVELDYDRCAPFECDYNDTEPVALICMQCSAEYYPVDKRAYNLSYDVEQDKPKGFGGDTGIDADFGRIKNE
jgi:hypothetical protein